MTVDSLYNPHYGYFSKQATIFSTNEPFNFESIDNEPQFHKELGKRYTALEDELDETDPDDTRQLWHTPTELFKPYYGEAIARYLIENYRLWAYPYHDLIIYEMGAGNGTLMLNILDYIRRIDPEVYARTRFRIVEVSSALASTQRERLQDPYQGKDHVDRVEIFNRSIFDWNEYVNSPCFFLALEVFDNFAHDALRYDPMTKQPLQSHVLIDRAGELFELNVRTLDPLAKRYLRIRSKALSSSTPQSQTLQQVSNTLRKNISSLLLTPDLSPPEFIPTRLIQFFDILRKFFPRHNLVCSDFHSLPDAIRGKNAPVVQTRYKRRTVPVSTPLVRGSLRVRLNIRRGCY